MFHPSFDLICSIIIYYIKDDKTKNALITFFDVITKHNRIDKIFELEFKDAFSELQILVWGRGRGEDLFFIWGEGSMKNISIF